MRASQEWTFFCVITPGLEALALLELHEKKAALGLTTEEVKSLPGGIELALPWSKGIGLVHLLKIPTRVIVRLTSITARDFPKLHQKALNLPWTKWLAHPTPNWKITAHQCRLMHTGRLEETMSEALKKSHVKSPFSNRWQKENISPETLYVRGVDDEWTISLDITGDALYKRGLSVVKGEAPLRETLAQACLKMLFSDSPQSPVTLWDPMCGSGTFLFEALTAHLPSQRSFSYLTSELNRGVAPWKPYGDSTAFPIAVAHGSDTNRELISKLVPLEKMSFSCTDLFSGSLQDFARPLWVIANPPYGERIEISEGIAEFTRKLSHFIGEADPDKVLLLVPSSWPHFKIKNQKFNKYLRFLNGGLSVEARLWDFSTPT
jgi:putative N6-adenine-specific DNA methylase